MKTFYDCIPCFIKQTLDVSRLSSPEDDAVHGEIVKAVLNKIIDIDMNTAPPIVARDCHRIIKALSGNNDPYKFIKDKFNKEALALYPQLKAYIDNAEDKFYMAAKVAIAGNIIDFGHRSVNDDFNLLDSVKVVLSQEPAINNIDYLKNQVESAAKILYIADNAGEIVFDKLFIEHIMPKNIVFAVRKYPIINDANYEDAEFVGLTDMVKVIENGTDVPGTYLADCSDEFKQEYYSADLIISKGQGNYETLGDNKENIVFLLKAKCDCVAKDIGCNLNDILIISKNHV